LKHTEFHLFKPQRDLIDWKVTSKIEKLSLGSFYLMKRVGDQIVRKVHSRHGNDEVVEELDYFAKTFHGEIDKRELILEEMNVDDIRYELWLRGMPTNGRKDELKNYMKQALREELPVVVVDEENLNLSGMDVKTLRLHLRRLHLPFIGKKHELVNRMNTALSNGAVGDDKGRYQK
jgi:hypothetical protein